MSSADPVLDMSLREVRAVLFEELNGLPERYRAPLVLCGLEEKFLEEAARLLGWTKGAVKGRLQRGRELLRARLRGRGLDLPAGLAATALALNSASGQVAAALASSTLRAAVQVAAGGGAVAGVASAEVAALIEGASPVLFCSKAKLATVLLLVMGVTATAYGVVRHRAPTADQPATQQSQAEKPKAPGGGPRPGTPPKPEAQEAIVVRGRVLDPDGNPVAGARLYLAKPTPKRFPPNGPAPALQATSGRDGRFRFAISRSELAKGSAEWSPSQVMAVAEGYGCDWLAVGPAEEELTLRLVKDVPITVRILDPDGRPVAGARLTVISVFAPQDLGSYLAANRKGEGYTLTKSWDGPLAGRPAVATTGADGRFRVAGAGRERVVGVRLEGPAIASVFLYVMTRVAETDAGGSPQRGWWSFYGASSDYVALASRPVRGVVRDKETGKPLAGVTVAHYHGQGPEAVTDKDGRYELLGLVKTREYSLDVKPADGLHFHRRIQLQDAPGLGPLTCDIELVRWLTVRGRVTDKETGKPVVGAQVEYHPLGGNPNVNVKLPGSWNPHAEAMTGPDGSYALTVMPGPGAITVTAPERDKYMPAAVTFEERKEFFKTSLVDDDAEDSLPRASGGGSGGGISLGVHNAVVLLEPGEKEETLVRDVALQKPLERKGRVVGPDGRPLSGVRVCDSGQRGAETLKGNEFTVRGVNARANRTLVFYHKEKNLGFYLKDLRGERADPMMVKLQPCGSASGRVLDPDGQPVAGLPGVLYRVDYYGRIGSIRSDGEVVITDKDGRFRVEGLVPGQEYRVSRHGDRQFGHLVLFAPLIVKPGEHKDMGDIKMEAEAE
jgi:protocatechuate 3,4-dioxygenase beta subunit